ncbi:MAG: NAD(P)-dependent oxidoreductase [Cyanobacteriota bacterium]|nr:NAD(P)-dependent oxidoreductase [Cyanobacteriota bacterium]
MSAADLHLGFVGLGALGLPMACNLAKAGYPLQVHTRSRNAEGDPGLKGAKPCASPRATADAVDVLLLCVSDDAAVVDVLFGPDGAADGLKPGSLVLDCSTIAPATAQTCAKRLAQRNVGYLDAPVTGGTEGARAGTLTVLVGADPNHLKRVQPLLAVIGGCVHHFGEVGRGQQVKAVNQVLVAGSYAAVAEAMALGERLDLPMDQVVAALKSGAAGSWALEHRAPGMLSGRYPLGFKLSLHHKDLGIALATAESVQLELPVSALVQTQEADLIQKGYGNDDVSALHRLGTI